MGQKVSFELFASAATALGEAVTVKLATPHPTSFEAAQADPQKITGRRAKATVKRQPMEAFPEEGQCCHASVPDFTQPSR